MSAHRQGVRALPLLLLAFTVTGLACKAPTYDELEQERPRQCNEAHACASGYSCVSGVCVKGGDVPGAECQPNAQRPCGDLERGECRKGTQTCGSDAKWGICVGEVRPATEACNGKDDDCDGATDNQVATATCALTVGVCAGAKQACVAGQLDQVCTAASYGADYEPSESRCDSKDNDCDGQTDEDLSQNCENQLGVCAGARALCVSGAFASCTEATYRTHSPAFETFELTCGDSRDNDCDGRSDAWDARNVSISSGVPSKSPKVAVIPGGTGMSAVILYEEDGRVLSRTVGPSGLSTPRSPSVPLPERASLPVIASDSRVMAAAWVEVVGGAPRVVLTLLGADGTSQLPERGVRKLFNTLENVVPKHLAIAVHNNRVAVAMQDDSNPSTPAVYVTTLTVPGSPDLPFTTDYEVRVSSIDEPSFLPHVSPASDTTFNVAWEVLGKGITLKTLKVDGNPSRTITGEGGGTAHEPQVFTTLASGVTLLYYLGPNGIQDSLHIRQCGQTNCTTVEGSSSNPSGPSMSELTMVAAAVGEQPLVALWSEAEQTLPVRFAARTSSGFTSGTLTPDGANGHGPAAAILSSGTQRTLLALFATDSTGGGGLVGNEVYVRPSCLP